MLRLLGGARFQGLFHSPPGVLFTFPSRYSSTVGHGEVLSLGWWSTLLPAGFHVPGGTRGRGTGGGGLRVRGPNPLRRAFPCASARPPLCDSRRGCAPPGDPRPQPRGGNARALESAPRFGLAPFRSPLLGGSRLDFPSSGYLDVSVPPVASRMSLVAGPRLLGSPIRAPRDLSLSAAPPGLSRLPAPFVGPPCQGIRRAPAAPGGLAPGAGMMPDRPDSDEEKRLPSRK